MATEGEETKKKIKKYCIARDCTNTDRDPDITFFSLPKEDERRRRWLLQVGREDLAERDDLRIKSHVLCSVHFKKSSIRTVTKLAGDAVPEPEDEDVSASTGPTLRFRSQVKVLTFTVETQTEPYVPEEQLLLPETTKKRKLGEEQEKPIGCQQDLLVEIKKEVEVDVKEEVDLDIKKEVDVDIKKEVEVKKEPETFDELHEDVSR